MNFWKRPPALIWGLWLALLALLPVLAYWQYRWQGEVSEALRDRMQRSLKTSATQFGQDFDQELTFAYVSLQDPPTPVAQLEPFAERYRRWAAAAVHPRLVRAVYEAELNEQGGYAFRRFDPATGTFGADAALAATNPEITQDLERLQTCFASKQASQQRVQQVLKSVVGEQLLAQDLSSGEHKVRQTRIEVTQNKANNLNAQIKAQGATVIQVSAYDALDEQLVGLVMPQSTFPRGLFEAISAKHYRIVLFDQAYLAQEFFPELAAKHLHNLGRDEYHFAVLTAVKNTPEVLYSTDGQTAASSFATTDAAERFFKLRLDSRDLMFMRQFGHPMPAVSEGRKGYAISLFTNEVKMASKDARLPLSKPLETLTSAKAEGAWQVVIKHRAGSLEAAVAKVRRRNLAISFGVLALLGVSVGLIVFNSRRAQALAAKQMEFVAGISHELRTPLAVICSAAENLADGVVENREQTKRYGTLIRDEGRRLTGMVEQVLEFAGAQSGKKTYDLRPLAPEQVINDALTALHLPLAEQGFSVEKQLPAELPLIRADAAALSRALQNLMSNAMKYSGESRWLGLQVQVAATPTGEELRLAVQDRGLGIAATELPHIFEPFYRGKEVTAAQIHGNGLGLSLVKHIVEAHGGRVSVASKTGQGSTFTLHLPVLREAAVMTPLLANDYEQAPAAR